MLNRDLLLAHPREFINGFSLYFPIDEDLLSRYEDFWNWKLLSKNTAIAWSEGMLERFEDRWNWGYNGLSSNKSLPWSAALLEKFGARWSWYHLGWQPKVVNDASMLRLCFMHWTEWHQKNLFSVYAFMPAVKDTAHEWAASSFESWPALNWSLLSHFEGFPWTETFIDKHAARFDWKAMSGNKGLPWSSALIHRYLDRWDWRALSYCEAIPWTTTLLREFSERIHWGMFSANQYRSWDVEILLAFREELEWITPMTNEAGEIISLGGLFNHASITWTPALFHACNDAILAQFNQLISQEREAVHGYVILDADEYWTVHMDAKNWSIEYLTLLIETERITGKRYINWNLFARNFNRWVVLNKEIFDKCIDSLDIDRLASNVHFPWSQKMSILERLTTEKDTTGSSGWERLSANKGVELNIDMVASFESKWDWRSLSLNPSLTVAMIHEFIEQWDWEMLFQNERIAIELLQQHPDRWDEWWKYHRNPPFGILENFHVLIGIDSDVNGSKADLRNEIERLLQQIDNRSESVLRTEFLAAVERADFSLLVPTITHEKYLPLFDEFAELILSHKWNISLVEELAAKAYRLAKSKRFAESIRLFTLIFKLELNPGQKVSDLTPYCNALYVLQHDNTGLPIDASLNQYFLDKCLPYGPKNPAIYFNAACLYAEMNLVDQAIDCIVLARQHKYAQYDDMIEKMKRDSMFFAVVSDERFKALDLNRIIQ